MTPVPDNRWWTPRSGEGRYVTVLDTTREGVIVCTPEGCIDHVNARAADLLGRRVDQLVGRSIADLAAPAGRPALAGSQSAGGTRRYDAAVLRPDGAVAELAVSAGVFTGADGAPDGLLYMVTDIGERIRSEAAHARLARQDPLTGLANRSHLLDRLRTILAHPARPSAAAVFIDLDNFKQINDSFGHTVGDQLLCAVADILRAAVRPGDVAARFAGDEFVLVLHDIDEIADAAAVAESILEALGNPIMVDGAEVFATASIGIASTPAIDAPGLLRDADAAMYRAKQRGGRRYEVFDPSLYAQAAARRELEDELRRAVRAGQLEVRYQPVVALDGRLTGFEALTRWTHPTRGPVPPGDFIPMAEATGLIVELGAWVLDEACRCMARWREASGRDDLVVSVNLSGRQLADPHLATTVGRALSDHGLDPSALWLEITETVLMDESATTTTVLTAIHDLGVRLAVDDFGTGYSSLLYLQRFPVDALKLDRFFVAGLERDERDQAIVRAVIELSHSLHLDAIAEGVETAGQLESLTSMGCDMAQGYYWSAAVPATTAEGMVRSTLLHPAGSLAPPAAGQPPAPPASLSPAAEPVHLEARRAATVVVIDDAEGDRSLLVHQLRASHTFEVVGEASDGAEGVDLVDRLRPDVVLLDMSMPQMDGFETLPRVMAASPATRVVILSGFVSAGMRTRALHEGAVAVLEKGASYHDILDRLSLVVTGAPDRVGVP